MVRQCGAGRRPPACCGGCRTSSGSACRPRRRAPDCAVGTAFPGLAGCTDELSQSGTSMSPRKDTQKSAKNTTSINKKFKGFSAEERVAMKERIQELKASARGPRADKADGESAVLAKIDEMPEPGSRHGQTAPCDHQIQRASPLAETLVRDARLCQGRQRRLLLPKRAEVQGEVRDVRLQRQGEPR